MRQTEIFDQNHRLSPLKKCKFFHFSKSMFEESKMTIFLCKVSKHFVSAYFALKQRMRKFQIFDQNHRDHPLWKTAKFLTAIIRFFNSVKWLVLYLEGFKALCFGLFCLKAKNEKVWNFWLKPWTVPCEKMQNYLRFLNRYFISPKCLDFYLQGFQTLCPGLFCLKTSNEVNWNFWPKPWTNPF